MLSTYYIISKNNINKLYRNIDPRRKKEVKMISNLCKYTDV